MLRWLRLRSRCRRRCWCRRYRTRSRSRWLRCRIHRTRRWSWNWRWLRTRLRMRSRSWCWNYRTRSRSRWLRRWRHRTRLRIHRTRTRLRSRSLFCINQHSSRKSSDLVCSVGRNISLLSNVIDFAISSKSRILSCWNLYLSFSIISIEHYNVLLICIVKRVSNYTIRSAINHLHVLVNCCIIKITKRFNALA